MNHLLNKYLLTEVVMGKENDEFYLDIKDPDIVSLDRTTGELTAIEEGETTVKILI